MESGGQLAYAKAVGGASHFEYFAEWQGLGIAFQANAPALLGYLPAVLPPGCTRALNASNGLSYRLELDSRKIYTVSAHGSPVFRGANFDLVLSFLRGHIEHGIAERAPRHLFVHAGVVAWRGRAILLPGPSRSGKSELVRELIRAGAAYCSDEFAALDEGATVAPFARRLSLRTDGGRLRLRPEDVSAATAEGPLSLGLIAFTSFAPGADFAPRSLTPGGALLQLLQNTVTARVNPRRSLSILKAAASCAPAVQSLRGEAARTAGQILDMVDRNLSGTNSHETAATYC